MKLFIKILVWITMIPILVIAFIPMVIYYTIKDVNEACNSSDDDDDDLTYMMMYHYYRNKHNNE